MLDTLDALHATHDPTSAAPLVERLETLVMVVTVAVVVATNNLAIGVVVAVLVAMTLIALRVAHLASVSRELVEDADGRVQARYTVTGELFFASSNDFYEQFRYAEDPDLVVIDLSASHVWDASTVAALDGIEAKYARRGTRVEIEGLNWASAHMHKRLSGRLPSH